MPFGYNLRGSIQIVKNLFFIRIPCSLSFLFGFLVHSTGSMCIYLLSNLSQPSRIYIHQIDFYNNFAFFLLCLNPYLWAQCLWATFSGFKIISSAYETTFCDWLSRPMKMIFTPKAFLRKSKTKKIAKWLYCFRLNSEDLGWRGTERIKSAVQYQNKAVLIRAQTLILLLCNARFSVK